MDVEFWTGGAIRGLVRVQSLDPVSGGKTPEASLPSVTIRFRNPDGTVLAVRTLSDGVVNAGDGYYYATAVPTVEGLHTLEYETGGANPGRDKLQFNVEPF